MDEEVTLNLALQSLNALYQLKVECDRCKAAASSWWNQSRQVCSDCRTNKDSRYERTNTPEIAYVLSEIVRGWFNPVGGRTAMVSACRKRGQKLYNQHVGKELPDDSQEEAANP